MRRRAAATLGATVLLGACAVGPDYQAPAVGTPDAFVSQDVFALLNQDAAGPALAARWWEGFEDPLLTRLVERAVEDNPEIAAAAARLRGARAQLALARTGNALDVTASTETAASERERLGESGEGSSSSLLGGLAFSRRLDVFGRTARAVEAARAGVEAAQAGLRDAVLTTTSEVALEFLRLRGNQRQLALLEDSVALQEQTVDIVESRYRAGLAPELDLRRAETSVARLRADIPPLQRSLIDGRNRLASLTGRYPGAYEDMLAEGAGLPRYRREIPAPVPMAALRARPDIRAAEAELKRAVAEIGVAEAAFYPLFELFGDLQISTSGITGGPAMDLIVASLSGIVDQVVADGGARAANLDAARARADEALAQYRAALLEAARSVEATLAALQASAGRQRSLERAVATSRRSFEQAERLYQLGLSSFLDVVDAQRVLANAEQQLASERTAYATRIATLFRELGAEVEPPAPRPGRWPAEAARE